MVELAAAMCSRRSHTTLATLSSLSTLFIARLGTKESMTGMRGQVGVVREAGAILWLGCHHETNCGSLFPLFKYIPLLVVVLLLFVFIMPKMNRSSFAH